jgi:ABC-type uncharacterized transport system substrate-binding protein
MLTGEMRKVQMAEASSHSRLPGVPKVAPAVLALFAATCFSPAVQAHPHVFVEARVEVLMNEQDEIEALRHEWKFDPTFSGDILAQNDADGDGLLAGTELETAAANSMLWVDAYAYFTRLSVGTQSLKFLPPSDPIIRFDEGRAKLTFTLPVSDSVAGQSVAIDIFDPEYYFAFEFSAESPFQVVASTRCKANLRPKDAIDPATAIALRGMAALRGGTADPRLADPAAGFPTRILLSCG